MKNVSKLFILPVLLIVLASCEKDEEITNLNSPADNQVAFGNLLFDEGDILDALGFGQGDIFSGSARSSSSTVYTLSNEAAGNRLITFHSNADGSLTEGGSYATGGAGTDGGLGNQGALALSQSGRLLFAVNAGSNEISAFYIRNDGTPELIDTVPSEGETPISITAHHGLVYVLNAGGTGNIAGFGFTPSGELVHIPNSVQPLSSDAAGPAQISFSPNGQALVVTEKATNTITSYAVSKGLAGAPSAFPSAGVTPFGFSFGNGNVFFVSEASGGAAGASTVSAYQVNASGTVTLVDGPFATNGSAACWVAAANNGQTLFVTNTASDDVSSLSVQGRGQLDFANNGLTTASGDGPLDAIVNRNSSYLYTLAGGSDEILTFAIGHDGALTLIDTDGGLPDRATGLVVR